MSESIAVQAMKEGRAQPVWRKSRSGLKGDPLRGSCFCEHHILWIKLATSKALGAGDIQRGENFLQIDFLPGGCSEIFSRWTLVPPPGHYRAIFKLLLVSYVLP